MSLREIFTNNDSGSCCDGAAGRGGGTALSRLLTNFSPTAAATTATWGAGGHQLLAVRAESTTTTATANAPATLIGVPRDVNTSNEDVTAAKPQQHPSPLLAATTVSAVTSRTLSDAWSLVAGRLTTTFGSSSSSSLATATLPVAASLSRQSLLPASAGHQFASLDWTSPLDFAAFQSTHQQSPTAYYSGLPVIAPQLSNLQSLAQRDRGTVLSKSTDNPQHQQPQHQQPQRQQQEAAAAADASSDVVSQWFAQQRRNVYVSDVEQAMEQTAGQPYDAAQKHAAETHPAQTHAIFDSFRAASLLKALEAAGGNKARTSEFYAFVSQFADGSLAFDGKILVDGGGHEADWELRRLQHSEVSKSEAKNQTVATLFDITDEDGEVSADGLMQSWERLQQQGVLSEADVGQMRSLFGGGSANTAAAAGGSGAFYKMGEDHQRGLERSPSGKDSFNTNHENDFLSEAVQLLAEGRVKAAIDALQQEVAENPLSSEGWRLLGEVHAENDQDFEAIECLNRGHEVDPLNLESGLALGVCYTNELNSVEALRRLYEWVTQNEEFASLPGVHDATPDTAVELRQHVSRLLDLACATKPECFDAHIASGVAHNINRNFDAALRAFSRALRSEVLKSSSSRRGRPYDSLASAWNKLGATLANSGRSEAAIEAYRAALTLKPNFPRALSNLGIAHSNLGRTDEALTLFASALSLNSGAVHLWHLIRSAGISLRRDGVVEAAGRRDVIALREEVPGVLQEETLLPAANVDETQRERILSQAGLLPA